MFNSVNTIENKFKNISAIILAGGESKRFGENKALLKLGNKSIIEHICDVLLFHFDEILINSNNLSDFEFLNLKVVKDIYKNHRPLSGVHAELVNSRAEKIFFISCDLPCIDLQSIDYLINNSFDSEITLPAINNYQLYVCGVYSKSVIPEIETLINETDNKPSLKRLIKKVNTKLMNIEAQSFFDEKVFINMNTKEDYEVVKKYYEQKK